MRRASILVTIALGTVLLVVMLGVGGLGALNLTDSHDTGVPSATVWPTVGELGSSSNYVMLGTGFEPGQEVRVLLQTTIGRGSDEPVISDISEVLDPAPVADGTGNFAARFLMDRFERVTLEGTYGIAVTDNDYNILATAPVVFCDPNGRSRVGAYPRGAPDYAENPDDPRPAPFCAGIFEYPERPES